MCVDIYIVKEKENKVIGEWQLQFWSDKEGIIIKVCMMKKNISTFIFIFIGSL